MGFFSSIHTTSFQCPPILIYYPNFPLMTVSVMASLGKVTQMVLIRLRLVIFGLHVRFLLGKEVVSTSHGIRSGIYKREKKLSFLYGLLVINRYQLEKCCTTWRCFKCLLAQDVMI